MSIQQVTKVQSSDPVLNRIQDQLQKLNPVLANPLLNGNLVGPVALDTSPVAVNHLLGRNYIGWFVVDIDAAETVFRVGIANPAQVINLQASGACNVKLYCF